MVTSNSALEQLLPELQRQILFQLESFETLYAFIHASSRIYQVFRLNKKAILSKIAYRQFDQSTIQDALEINNLCKIEQPPFSRDTLLEYPGPALNGRRDGCCSTLPLQVSTRLSKLDAIVRFFVDDYLQNTLPIVEQLNNSERPSIKSEYTCNSDKPKPTISKSEFDRLRRAFCRFETYRQLFGRCATGFDHIRRRCLWKPSMTIYEQGEMFFGNMPAYQATEIACVRDYLHRRLRGALDQVEDEAVRELQAGFPNPKDMDQALEWDHWANGGRHHYMVYDEHFLCYNGKSDQSYHIEFLSSLGLHHVRQILELAGHQRLVLLLRLEEICLMQKEMNFITPALSLHFWDHDSYGHDRDLDSCLDATSRLDLPPGWIWAHRDDYYRGIVRENDKGFRDWGYVFWDLDRLHNAGVLDLDPHTVRQTSFRDFLANDRPSVQERWLGRRLPDGVEEGYDVGSGGQNEDTTEDPKASDKPSTYLSSIRQWLQTCWQGLRNRMRRYQWLEDGCLGFLKALRLR